jgi:hypothetical protein
MNFFQKEKIKSDTSVHKEHADTIRTRSYLERVVVRNGEATNPKKKQRKERRDDVLSWGFWLFFFPVSASSVVAVVQTTVAMVSQAKGDARH